MNAVDEVRKRYIPFSLKATKEGGTPWLRPLMAMRFILDAIEAGGKVTAIERLDKLPDGTVQPSLDDSPDFAEMNCSYDRFLGIVAQVICENATHPHAAFFAYID